MRFFVLTSQRWHSYPRFLTESIYPSGMNVSPSLFPTPGVNIMTAITTNNAANNANTTSTKAEHYDHNIKGLGYLSNIRRIDTLTGSFLSVVIDALNGPTDNPYLCAL